MQVGDILYVRAFRNYLKIKTGTGDYLVRQTMACLQEMLPDYLFFRSHRSYPVTRIFQCIRISTPPSVVSVLLHVVSPFRDPLARPRGAEGYESVRFAGIRQQRPHEAVTLLPEAVVLLPLLDRSRPR